MREFWGTPPEGYSVFARDINFSENVGHWYMYVVESAAASDAFEVKEWDAMLQSGHEDFMEGLFPEIVMPKAAAAKSSKKKIDSILILS